MTGTIEKPLAVMHKEVTGTTSSDGIISTGLSLEKYIIIGASISRSKNGTYTGYYSVFTTGITTGKDYALQAVANNNPFNPLGAVTIVVDVYYINR